MKTVIELAKEAGYRPLEGFEFANALEEDFLKRFAALVRSEREWIDLTDYEIVRLYAESPMCDSEMIDFARAVIAAFKEKNK